MAIKVMELPPEIIEKMKTISREELEGILRRAGASIRKKEYEIVQQAVEKGLLTWEEYNSHYKERFINECGTDSFLEYLIAIIDGRTDCFVTGNQKMLEEKESLQKRFNLNILSVGEMLERLEGQFNTG